MSSFDVNGLECFITTVETMKTRSDKIIITPDMVEPGMHINGERQERLKIKQKGEETVSKKGRG